MHREEAGQPGTRSRARLLSVPIACQLGILHIISAAEYGQPRLRACYRPATASVNTRVSQGKPFLKVALSSLMKKRSFNIVKKYVKTMKKKCESRVMWIF